MAIWQNRARRLALKESGKKLGQGDLRLLLAEIGQYLRQVRLFLGQPSARSTDDLSYKMAYITTLSQVARNNYFDLERCQDIDQSSHKLYHCLASISVYLHRISELALNVVRQVGHLSHPSFLDDYGLDEFFDVIDQGLSLIRPALEQRKFKLVVRICHVEERLDALYADRFRRLIKEMEEGRGQPGDRVTTLMVVHYLERIGDLILDIGEELIHAILGEDLRFSQYQALAAGLKASRHAPLTGFQSIWSGRSGCRVCLVGYDEAEDGGEPVIFKHGPAAKLEKERDNLETWDKLWPGLSPKILVFVPGEADGQAAMLLEYIRGATLRDMFINFRHFPKVGAELTGALEVMAELWRTTREEQEIRAGFSRQAEKRLGSVEALYPDVVNFEGSIGRVKIKSLASLLAEARRLERLVPAPFAVRVHGDFNLSNVMRDAASGNYRFIDLYRSHLSDYVQDMSVMILSILRLPLFDITARSFLAEAAQQVWVFAKNFASVNNDSTFEARVGFGLARSFLTSARFEARASVAIRFLGYSRYILTKLIEYGCTGRSWADFKLDKRVLYI